MIKWKKKNEEELHYAKGGLCFKLKPETKNNTNKSDAWVIWFKCYTNGVPSTLFSKNIKVHRTADRKLYMNNLKNRASKVAKRTLNNYANRINIFLNSVEA